MRWAWIVCGISLASPAAATLGGPDLATPLGWDPTTKEAYFSIEHVGESGDAPTIVRLRLAGPDTAGCEPLWWSKGVEPDSTYDARLRRLTKKLRPLKEEPITTIPDLVQIVSMDTFKTEWQGPFARFRVRGQFRAGEGTVEAVTYIDHAVRMLRYYYVPELRAHIGLFSFIGIPWESGYECQIPAIVPQRRGSHILLQWHREWE